MTLVLGLSLVRRFLPQQLARLLVQTAHLKSVDAAVVRGVAGAVQAVLERGVVTTAHRGRDEQPRAVDHGAGVGQTGNRDLEPQVRAGLGIHELIELGALKKDPGGGRTAERGPTPGGGPGSLLFTGDRREGQHEQDQTAHARF